MCSDIDNSGYVSDFELQELFKEASLSVPGYKVREIIETFIAGDTNKDEKISFEEFVSVSHVRLFCGGKFVMQDWRADCPSIDLSGAEE